MPGCLTAVLDHAGIEAKPPYRLLLYADQTQLQLGDATNETPTEPTSPGTWRHEVHRFEAPAGSTNLTVHVSARLVLPPEAADGRVQNVTVQLSGPSGETREASFGVSGERDWRFPGDVSGPWQIVVDGRGRGEVSVVAAASNDGRGL